jgi:hypothetical protein
MNNNNNCYDDHDYAEFFVCMGTYPQGQNFLVHLSFQGILSLLSCQGGLPTPATQIMLVNHAILHCNSNKTVLFDILIT